MHGLSHESGGDSLLPHQSGERSMTRHTCQRRVLPAVQPALVASLLLVVVVSALVRRYRLQRPTLQLARSVETAHVHGWRIDMNEDALVQGAPPHTAKVC